MCLDAIVKAFEEFFKTIQAIIDFVIGLFEDLLFMIELLAKFIVQIPSYFSWLPDGFVAVVVVLFSVVVIYKILGREG